MKINCFTGWINQQEKVINIYQSNYPITKIQKNKGNKN